MSVVLTVGFCAGYFSLQYYHFGKPRTMPLSAMDHWVEYQPGWALVYQSMYLMMPLAWLAETRHQLRRYVVGFGVVTIIGFGWFFFDPVICPRPATESAGMLGLIHQYDSPLNSFPSLHMALATYVSCFCVQVLRGRAWMMSGLSIWVLLIAYATLATKQHYAVDAIAGIVLGFLGHSAARLAIGAGVSSKSEPADLADVRHKM